MKTKLYTNKTVVPTKIRTFFIENQKVQYINDSYIIASDFDIPLCFPIHFVLHKNRVIPRAYIEIKGNYIKIPIPPNHYELMNKAKEIFDIQMVDYVKKSYTPYVSLHKYNC